MDEEKKESRTDLGSLLKQLVERPELLHNVRFVDANTIDFVIGDKRGAYTLWYLPPNLEHGDLPCYLLNHTELSLDEGADLWRTLRTAGRDTLARTLERDMTQEVLVSPEQDAEMRSLEDGLACSAFVVRYHSGRYWVRYKATGDDIEAFEDYNSALQRARKLNAERYGFQRQQEGDAR